MPKSKECFSDSASDGEATASKKTVLKDSNDTNEPAAKRVKTNDQEDDAVPSKAGLNGERLYEIGRLRYVSVSEFKGKSYINIREYYDDNGVEKPGKKGISLPVDQWDKLKAFINQVDKEFKKSK